MHTKQIPVSIQKSDVAAYDARFVMSAATPDRVKDTIEPSAYAEAAASTPRLIALWQHDADKPIGTWERLKAEGDRLTGYIRFASTSLAQMARQLIADGVPLAASIGFRGQGEPKRDGGLHFKTIELLECSIVSCPAHPRAVQIAKSFGVELPAESPAAREVTAAVLEARAKAVLQASLRAVQAGF